MNSVHRVSMGLLLLLLNTGRAGAADNTFVAPGLWRIITEVHGPLEAHEVITQNECWSTQGESTEAMAQLSRGGIGTTTNTVTNTDLQSIVHLHSILPTPQGVVMQNETMIFTRQIGGIPQATMKGHGAMSGPSPMDNDSFVQHGHWLAASCPNHLPKTQTKILQNTQMPGMPALQKLANQLQAEDPHPNGK